MRERRTVRLRSALAALARAVAERLERVALIIAEDPTRERRDGSAPNAAQEAGDAGPAAWLEYLRRHGTGAWEGFEHPAMRRSEGQAHARASGRLAGWAGRRPRDGASEGPQEWPGEQPPRRPAQGASPQDHGPAPSGIPQEPFTSGNALARRTPGEARSSTFAGGSREADLAAWRPGMDDRRPDLTDTQRPRASLGPPPPARPLRPVRLWPVTGRDEGPSARSRGAEPTDRPWRASGAWETVPHGAYGSASPSKDDVGSAELGHQRYADAANGPAAWPPPAPAAGREGTRTGADATTLQGLNARHAGAALTETWNVGAALTETKRGASAWPGARHPGAQRPLAGREAAADSDEGPSFGSPAPITWPPAPEAEPEIGPEIGTGPELAATLWDESLRLLEERRHRERLAREQRGVPWSE